MQRFKPKKIFFILISAKCPCLTNREIGKNKAENTHSGLCFDILILTTKQLWIITV